MENKTFERNGVEFTIRKLLPIEAKRAFLHHVRPLLRGALSANNSAGGNAGIWQIVLAGLTDAPVEHYDALMRMMYQHILFTSKNEKVPQVLLGNEELAFKDLDMAHIMALDARAFMVNFGESWDVMISEFRALKSDLPPMSPGM